MSHEVIPYEPGRDLVDYPADADIVVSRADLVALADETPSRELDRAACKACEVALRRHWGDEFDQRLALNAKVLTLQFGEELADDLLYARMPNGIRVADEPRFSAALNELICIAMQAIGAEPSASASTSLEEQKRQIEELMAANMSRYYAEGWDREYAAILEEMERRGMISDIVPKQEW